MSNNNFLYPNTFLKIAKLPKHNFNNVLLNLKCIKKFITSTSCFDYKIISRGEIETPQFCQRLLGEAFGSSGCVLPLNYWADGYCELEQRSRKYSMECMERVEPHLKQGSGFYYLSAESEDSNMKVCMFNNLKLSGSKTGRLNGQGVMSLTFGLGDGAANGGAGGGDGAHRRAHAIWGVNPSHGGRVGNPRCWVDRPDRLTCPVKLENRLCR